MIQFEVVSIFIKIAYTKRLKNRCADILLLYYNYATYIAYYILLIIINVGNLGIVVIYIFGTYINILILR